jgi:GT2 family glycosyltransferase
MTSQESGSPNLEPLVFIVVLNWNGLADTLDCLRSLDRLDYPNWRLVVVDNASVNDEAAQIQAAYPSATVLRNSDNLGYAGGNNRGIRHALAEGADYIWLLNNDTTIAATCVTELVREAEQRPDVGVLCPVIYEHGSEDEIQFAGAVLDRQREEHRTLRTLEALEVASKEGSILVWGTALLLPRKAVDLVGLLDERYFAYHEDMDYCLRVIAAGLGTLVVPRAKIHHRRWRSLGPGPSPGREYLLVRNWYLFWRTYLVGRQRRTYPRRYLAWALERAMNARRAGNIDTADHILDGAWDAIRGHWGPLQTKGRMPGPLRAVLSRGLLVWHPYLWLMLLAGGTSAVCRESVRRLRRSDT